jgi:hypothetical protein
LVSVSLESGIIPLCSAIIHTFFLEDLTSMTVCLVLMELSWFIIRLHFIYKGIFRCLAKAVIPAINNLLRILFLVTLYAFQNGANETTMNYIHLLFMVSYLGLWIIELIISFVKIIVNFFNFARKSCGKKIVPQNNEENINRLNEIV